MRFVHKALHISDGIFILLRFFWFARVHKMQRIQFWVCLQATFKQPDLKSSNEKWIIKIINSSKVIRYRIGDDMIRYMCTHSISFGETLSMRWEKRWKYNNVTGAIERAWSFRVRGHTLYFVIAFSLAIAVCVSVVSMSTFGSLESMFS